jgi:hypothetical protein
VLLRAPRRDPAQRRSRHALNRGSRSNPLPKAASAGSPSQSSRTVA